MLKTLAGMLVLQCAAVLAAAAAPAPDVDGAAREAHAMLTRLCDDFGGRPTGGAANERALGRLADELRALGCAPAVQRFAFTGWERGADRVELLTPLRRELRVAAVAYTQSHAAFDAEAVDLGDFAGGRAPGELAGRIGLLNPSTPLQTREFARAAAEQGLRAVLFINREGGGQLLARTGSFIGEALPLPVYSITQEEGRWLQRLLARGQPVRLRIETRSRCREVDTANLVLTLPGHSAERVVVGAHFDSWDLGQGAIDNGLGVAQLFALAHALRGRELARTVELVWFNGEEQGLWGSRHAAAQTGGAPIVAMMNLDMVGVPVAVNALGDDTLAAALERWHAARETKLPLGVQNVNWFGSDHTPYQLAGVRTLTFNAPIPRESVRYYHDFADTIDKLPEQILADSTAVIAEVVLALVNDGELGPAQRTLEETRALFTRFGLERRMRLIGFWPFDEEAKR